MRKRGCVLSIGILFLALCSGAFAKNEVPRVALVASGDEKADSIVALMEVELSQRDDVVLLDRKNVNRILGEQKFKLEGMLSSDDALKAGKLFTCDIFAELNVRKVKHAYDKKEFTETASVVAFDGATGVRLCDLSLPVGGKLDDTYKAAVKVLVSSLGKWQGVASAKGKTISLMSVRKIGLSPAVSSSLDSLGPLLERTLLASPEISVLERERLEHVNKEADLTEDRRARLLASTILVDLDISEKKKGKGLTIRVSLNQAGGKELSAVSFNSKSSDLITLAEDTAEKICTELKTARIVLLEDARGREADRFLSKCERLATYGKNKEALAARNVWIALSEAEYAARPESHKAFERICASLRWQTFDAYEKKDQENTLALLERGLPLFIKQAESCRGWKAKSRCMTIVSLILGSLDSVDTPLAIKLKTDYSNWYIDQCRSKNMPFNIYKHANLWRKDGDDLVDDLVELQESGVVIRSAAYYFDRRKLGGGIAKNLSTPHKRKLLGLYERDALNVSGHYKVQHFYCAALLVGMYPEEFPDGDTIIARNIRSAADLVIKQPYLIEDFSTTFYGPGGAPTSFAFDRPRENMPYSRPILTTESVVGEMRRVAEKMDARKIACPTLFLHLHMIDGAHAEYPGAYLDKAVKQVRDKEYSIKQPVWNYARKGSISYRRTRARSKIEQILNAYRGDARALAENPPRLSEKMIYQAAGDETIQSAELKGEKLFLLTLTTSPAAYRLYRVDIKTGTTAKVGEFKTDLKPLRGVGDLKTGVLGGYALMKSGVVVFPFNGSGTRILGKEQGLPCATVLSCVEADRRLYISCYDKPDSYFLSCKLDGSDIKLLACSARKEKHSALDDTISYQIPDMAHDVDRKRIFLSVAAAKRNDQLSGLRGDPLSGIWTFSLETGKISKLKSGAMARTILLSMRKSGCYMFEGRQAALWDPDKDKPMASLKLHMISIWHAPVYGRALTIFDGRAVYSISDSKWYTVRSQLDGTAKGFLEFDACRHVALPLLQDEAPFMLREYEGKLLACTRAGVWLADVAEPENGLLPKKTTERPAQH